MQINATSTSKVMSILKLFCNFISCIFLLLLLFFYINDESVPVFLFPYVALMLKCCFIYILFETFFSWLLFNGIIFNKKYESVSIHTNERKRWIKIEKKRKKCKRHPLQEEIRFVRKKNYLFYSLLFFFVNHRLWNTWITYPSVDFLHDVRLHPFPLQRLLNFQ